MTSYSHLSSKNLRRQPKQPRGKQRVEKILDAAAEVFAEMGYDAATTHAIAARANTAVGSLYQFFPDKSAIFHALELRHVERVRVMWAEVNTLEIIKLPLRQMVQKLVASVAKLFDQPTSRVVFIQFFTAPEIFQAIDENFTQEAIAFTASLLKQRHPALNDDLASLLAEVCVHCSNTLILIALRSNEIHGAQLVQQIEDLLVSYLSPHVGDEILQDKVMKVMKCPHCQCDRVSKNGHRHGKQRYLCKNCGKQFPETYKYEINFIK
jgi:AcrR family transcriptional regulator